MQGIGTIAIIALVAVVLLAMMSGRKVRYVCFDCGETWKGTKHHGNVAPRCPSCGSSNIGRK